MNPIARTFARTALALLAGAGGALAQNPAPQGAPAVSDLMRQARQLTAQGKLDPAVALYSQVLAQRPTSYEARLGMGVVHDLMGHYRDAHEQFDKALAIVPAQQKPEVLRAMAISYAFESDCASAARYDREAFDALVASKAYSGAAETANELARICLESGNVDSAFTWYQRGHATAFLQPQLTDSEKTLWDFRWEHAEARIAARRGMPAAARTHVAAARALLDRGLNPDQRRFFPYLTGYVAFYSGDFHGAVAELQQADQQDPFILALLAQAYEKTGDGARAQQLYQQILNINTHNPGNAYARPLARRRGLS